MLDAATKAYQVQKQQNGNNIEADEVDISPGTSSQILVALMSVYHGLELPKCAINSTSRKDNSYNIMIDRKWLQTQN